MHWSTVKEIRGRLSVALTGNVESRSALGWSLVLGSAATVAIIPHFHYLLFARPDSPWSVKGAEIWRFLFGQTVLVFLVTVLSCLIGFAFSRRLGLPGLGKTATVKRDFKWIACLGTVLSLVSLIGFDIWFIKVLPAAYPDSAWYLLSIPVKGALTEELILRFCMVTLAVGILKSKWAGVFVISILAPFLSLKFFRFVGVEGLPAGLLTIQFLLSFVSNMLLGMVFVTRGLFSCMMLKFFCNLKYVAIVALFL